MKITMFRKAQIRLTGWYLLIMMTLTISYSAIVYHNLLITTQKALEAHQERLEREYPEMRNKKPAGLEEREEEENIPFPNRYDNFVNPNYEFDMDALTYIRKKVLLNLIIINSVIALITGILGYFLAGITLRPIRKMVDKQKQFISDAAHEFRTPLAAMKAEIEVTLRDKQLNLLEAKTALEGSLEELNRLEILTQSLLLESRYQENQKPLSFESININKIIKIVIQNLEPIAKVKNIEIKLESNDVKVKGSEQGLNELFTILIDNAIKYSVDNTHIEIKIQQNRNDILISVKDQGVGIDEKDLPNIFDRFYRADQSRCKENVEGYGLGLSIAKEIVDLHKGEISIESSDKNGTTFMVKLPI